jgi:hypothetical protein
MFLNHYRFRGAVARAWLLLTSIFLACGCISLSSDAQPVAKEHDPQPSGKLLLAHYMPWYSAKPFSPFWGWHWTMGHYQADVEKDGRRQAASQYYPLIGLYDAGDPNVLDCQCILMKLSGIDGVIIDWYGTDDYLDYAINHRNTLSLIDAVKRCGLKFAICYEDSTVPGLISVGKFKAADSVLHAHEMLKWVDTHWFQDAAYVKIDDRPVFLVFGNGYYQDNQWDKIFDGQTTKPLLFTEAHQRAGSAGAFDWPHPQGGAAGSERETSLFYEQSRQWPQSISVAYPRFHDIYEQAGVQKSYGDIPDDNGKTFETTLKRALKSSARIVQIATWNDWGEGTQIEPSVEFGYRDLETVQRIARETIHKTMPFTASDLRLPVSLLNLKNKKTAGSQTRLDRVEQDLIDGRMSEARRLLNELSRTH